MVSGIFYFSSEVFAIQSTSSPKKAKDNCHVLLSQISRNEEQHNNFYSNERTIREVLEDISFSHLDEKEKLMIETNLREAIYLKPLLETNIINRALSQTLEKYGAATKEEYLSFLAGFKTLDYDKKYNISENFLIRIINFIPLSLNVENIVKLNKVAKELNTTNENLANIIKQFKSYEKNGFQPILWSLILSLENPSNELKKAMARRGSIFKKVFEFNPAKNPPLLKNIVTDKEIKTKNTSVLKYFLFNHLSNFEQLRLIKEEHPNLVELYLSKNKELKAKVESLEKIDLEQEIKIDRLLNRGPQNSINFSLVLKQIKQIEVVGLPYLDKIAINSFRSILEKHIDTLKYDEFIIVVKRIIKYRIIKNGDWHKPTINHFKMVSSFLERRHVLPKDLNEIGEIMTKTAIEKFNKNFIHDTKKVIRLVDEWNENPLFNEVKNLEAEHQNNIVDLIEEINVLIQNLK